MPSTVSSGPMCSVPDRSWRSTCFGAEPAMPANSLSKRVGPSNLSPTIAPLRPSIWGVNVSRPRKIRWSTVRLWVVDCRNSRLHSASRSSMTAGSNLGIGCRFAPSTVIACRPASHSRRFAIRATKWRSFRTIRIGDYKSEVARPKLASVIMHRAQTSPGQRR